MKQSNIIIVGRGGSGKDFLKNKLISKGFTPSISATTRPPREGELHGKDYYFRNNISFEEYPEQYYEIDKFNGWYYGTLKSTFENGGIFIMTPGGVKKIKPEDRKRCFVIYLNPPQDIIRKRLEARKGMQDSVERRIEADNKDFEGFTDYDMEVTNPEF